MAPTPAVYIAYTGEINPSGATPVLTREQVWAGLELKVEQAQDFVAGAILSTDVVSRDVDELGRKKTTREVVFAEGNRRVREEVVLMPPTKVVFQQPDGSHVQNIVSTNANGGMTMTYDFEWIHKGMGPEELEENRKKYGKMAQMAVEGSIKAIREMVTDGRIKA